jgi:hypothetical protein
MAPMPWRAVRAVLAITVLALAGWVVGERAPDVSLPGAAGRLGVGGGWWAGSWVSLRLEVSAPGSWRLTLTGEEGTLRAGAAPLTAEVTVPDAPGVRVRELRLPLLSRRPATLELRGPEASKKVTLFAFPGTPAVLVGEGAPTTSGGDQVIQLGPDEISPDPAAWLSGPRLLLDSGSAWLPRPSTLLAWLAAGGTVQPSGGATLPGLESLEPGRVGLGYLGEGRGSQLNLERVLELIAPRPAPPPRANTLLALWAGAAFVIALAVYSARRADRLAGYGAALTCLAAGVVGFLALQPGSHFREESVRVAIGAAGWGIETTVTTRFGFHEEAVRLPPAVKPIGLVARHYLPEATVSRQLGWSRLTYWAPPKAALVPLRVSGNRVENTSAERAEDLFVVGSQQQEPLAPGTSRVIPETFADVPPRWLAQLAEVLPQRTAIGRVGARLVIALPGTP